MSNNFITPKKIIDSVAAHYNLTPDELKSRSRVFNIKNARQVAMYLLSEELKMSTNAIAAEVGLQDHSTVMHGVKKIKTDIDTNFTLRDDITNIREKVYE